MGRFVFGSVLLVSLVGCAGRSAEQVAAHRAEIEEWRAGREARLRAPDGWLTLVGLYWLEPGDNSIGRDSASRVVLASPECPPRAGRIVVREGKARLAVEGDAPIRHAGAPVRSLDLVSDRQGEATILELGSLRFHLIERNGRLAVRVRDLESPALRSFTGMDEYEIDPAWRFEARFDPYDPPRLVEVPTITGDTLHEECSGALVFRHRGRDYRLDVLEEGDELFVIFGDQTNGTETYGGGRYIYTARPGADGHVVLDFNKAYNPPCVFTPYATCPFPPAQNRLRLAVTAGERAFEGMAR
jgi:hypothetical protein